MHVVFGASSYMFLSFSFNVLAGIVSTHDHCPFTFTCTFHKLLWYHYHRRYYTMKEPQHNKTNEMTCGPSEDSDQPGHASSLIKIFAVRLKKPWVFSFPLSASWSESSLGGQVILLVFFFCCGSNVTVFVQNRNVNGGVIKLCIVPIFIIQVFHIFLVSAKSIILLLCELSKTTDQLISKAIDLWSPFNIVKLWHLVICFSLQMNTF